MKPCKFKATGLNYHAIQNFGGRKLWQNSSLQKLADNILVNTRMHIKHPRKMKIQFSPNKKSLIKTLHRDFAV